jgi:hypothetical protein
VYTKFSFADPLYREVSDAFDIPVAVLQTRETKETPMEALQYWYCTEPSFQSVLFSVLRARGEKYPMDVWLSPRDVLQMWGTEYRRKQNPEYWIARADDFVRGWLSKHAADNEHVGGLVQTSVRFPNERAFIERWNGEVWHVRRPDWDKAVAGAQAAHEAEKGLPILPHDKVIHNNGTIEQLRTITNLMLAAQPGQVMFCAAQPVVEFVSCVGCGHVYKAATEAEVRAEIEDVAGWITGLSEDERARYNTLSTVTPDDYRHCDVCMTTSFKPLDPAEYPRRYREDVPTVIYESKAD